MSDDLVTQTLHSLEGLEAYVRALDEYNDALVAANEELKAKLAKAVKAIELARNGLNGLVDSNDAFDALNATLAELKGDTDE